MRILLDRRAFFRFAAGWLVASLIVQRAEAKGNPLTVPIHREVVESTNIASVGYHAELRVLEIEFRSGALYRYFAVPLPVFQSLLRAESKGRYFAKNIRGSFDFHRFPAVKP